jgi:outer membrane protein assembly factor BamB
MEMDQTGYSRRTALKLLAGAGTVVGPSAGAATAQQPGSEEPLVITGTFAMGPLVQAYNATNGDLVWTADSKGPTNITSSSPVVVDGTVYIGSKGGGLYAIDAATGDRTWTYDVSSNYGPVKSSPTVVDGTVYGANQQGTIFAVDAESGGELWMKKTQSPIRVSPTVVDETVYLVVGSDAFADGQVVQARDADTGEEIWSYDAEDPITSSTTVSDDGVFVGLESGLLSLSRDDGSKNWLFDKPLDGVSACPVCKGDSVFIVGRSDGGRLYRVDAQTGAEQWQVEGPSGIAAPTVLDGKVFAGTNEVYGAFFAVEAESGEIAWKKDTLGQIQNASTAHGSAVFVGANQSVHAFDIETGNSLWSSEAGSNFKSAPTVVANPADGSSVGSRTLLRTLGHHGDYRGNEPLSTGAETDTGANGLDGSNDSETSGSGSSGGLPGLGVPSALAAVAGGAYLRQRRASEDTS